MRKRRGEADDSTSFPLALGYGACLSSAIQRLAVFTDCFPTRARSTALLIDRQLDGTHRLCKAGKRRIEYGPKYVRITRNEPLTIKTVAQILIGRQYRL